MSEIFFAHTAKQLFRQIPVLPKLMTGKSSFKINPKVVSWLTLKKTEAKLFSSFHFIFLII